MSQFEKDLDHILSIGAIYPVFQPIVSLRDGSVLGYEALSRVNGEYSFDSVENLFETAVKYGKVWELEQLARKAAFESIAGQQREKFSGRLFLNVSPHVIYDGKFQSGFTRELTEKYGLKPEQVVFEITERESVHDLAGFRGIIEHYKQENYQIAIDDVGSGYSGLNLICDIRPHFIKLDMQLVRNVHKNSMQYAMIKGLIELSNISNIRLIAEGIENREEMEALINIGVHYGQGYYLGRPSRDMRKIAQEALEQIKDFNKKKHSRDNHGVDSYYIRNIASNGITVSPELIVESALGYMEKNKKQPGMCVVENGRVIGVLTREKLFSHLSGRYGYSLYQKKSISRIMERQFLQVDSYMPISAVASMAMEREEESLYDFIVVTEQEEYFGIVTIKDLLRKATEIDVNMARSANPLTGLPGNVLIEKEISRNVERGGSYTVLYFDLDNFKAFNDVYGFEKGDKVIRLLAEIIKEHVGEDGFVGHIGGDDFVAILHEELPDGFIEEVTENFETRAHKYYTKEDRERGYIVTSNRHGVTELFPLVSVTIASISSREQHFTSGYELTEELSARKKEKKKKKGKKK